MSTTIFRAKTPNAYNIKILAELLSNNIKVGHFVITKDSISLCMMDTHRRVLIDVTLLAENFSIYKLKKDKIYLGINLNHFHRMLKSIKKKDVLEFCIDSSMKHKLAIKVFPKEVDRVTTSYITIQSVQEIAIELPKTNSKPIIISSSEFQKMIKDMNNIGNNINIKAKTFNIQFSCETDGVLARKVDFGEKYFSDDEEEECEDEYSQNFSVEQLMRISKISGLSNNIKIYKGNPILFKSNIDNLGDILIYIKSNEQLEAEEHDLNNK